MEMITIKPHSNTIFKHFVNKYCYDFINVISTLVDRNDINRPFPSYLVAGVPNLVVCAQGKTYCTLI